MRRWFTAFIRGMGSVADLFGSGYRPAVLDRTDAEAIAGDWRAVGDDLRAAMKVAVTPFNPPNPGSVEARDCGCTCPVLDNRHGLVAPRPTEHWVITFGCPIHAPLSGQDPDGAPSVPPAAR